MRELPRILCVDDEPHVLRGLRLRLRREFDLETAESGAEGLELIERSASPFAVVVSDMRMPGMNGAAFLAQVRQRSPHTTRMLLTGQSDMTAAVAAVNEGGIFRFLCKPCPPDLLVRSITDGVRQHRLLEQERELTEGTVRGAVAMITETMAMVSPDAFGRAALHRRLARAAAEALCVAAPWQVELAAMVSQLGIATLPEAVRTRVLSGQPLGDDDEVELRLARAAATRMVRRIPRLEPVADIIAGRGASGDVVLGVRILRATDEVVRALARGASGQQAVAQLRGGDPELARALEPVLQQGTRSVRLAALEPGMVLADAVLTEDGRLLVAAGQEVTDVVCNRLVQFQKRARIREPLQVVATGPTAADLEEVLEDLPMPRVV